MNKAQQIITDQFCSDINAQLEAKFKFCLEKNGFDFLDYNRVLVVIPTHFDIMNEMWLDGILILKWSKFSFKQDEDKLIGSFEYFEL